MDVATLLIGTVVFFRAVAVLLVAVSWLARRLRAPPSARGRARAEALERRLARGEITQEEIEQAERALGA